MDIASYLPKLVAPAIALVVGVALGAATDRLLVARIRASARKSGWAGGEVAARAVTGMAPLWLGVAALWWGVVRLGLSARTEHFALNFLHVAVVISATWAAARLAGGLVRAYAARGDTPLPSASIFVNLTRLAVSAIGVLVALNAIGVQVAPLITALGISGLALALALQSTLTNLFAGLQIGASGQIHPGDVLRLVTGEEGVVEDITWRTTTLRNGSGALVIVPNGTLATVVSTNRGPHDSEQRLTVSVPVPYVADLAKVEAVALEIARDVQSGTDGAVAWREPSVRFSEFADNGVTMQVGLRAKSWDDRGALRHAFMVRLHRRLADEGMELRLPE